MISILNTLFVLSFYYMLTGFYMSIFTPAHLPGEPLGFGFLLLAFSVLLYVVIINVKNKSPETKMEEYKENTLPKLLCSVLPLIALLFEPTVLQLVHFIVAWLFVCYSIIMGKINTNSAEFNASFKLSLKLLWLCLPGLMFVTRLHASATVALPYFMLYLVSAVCLKRILRREGSINNSRTAVPVMIVVALSALFAVSQIRQIIVNAIRFVLEALIRLIASILIFLLGWLADIFARFFGYLVNSIRNEQIVPGQGGEGFVNVSEYEPAAWVQIVFGVFIFVIVVLAVWFLVKLLTSFFWGDRLKRTENAMYVEQSEWLSEDFAIPRRKLLKPRDHNQAVRWYYRKYLSAGAQGGAEIEVSDTSHCVMQKLGEVFPKSEQRSFRDVYVLARYRDQPSTQKEDVDNMARLWKQMKRENLSNNRVKPK